MTPREIVLEWLRANPRSGITAIRHGVRGQVAWNDVPVILRELLEVGEIKNDRQQSLYRVAGPTASNAVVQRLLRTVANVDSASKKQMADSVSAFQSAPETFKVLGQMCMAGWLIKVKGNRYQITASGLACLPKVQPAQHTMTPYKPPAMPPRRPGSMDFMRAPSIYPTEKTKPAAVTAGL